MQQYLESSRYIDWEHPEIKALAKFLSSDFNQEDGLCSQQTTAKNCFEWVRDNIKHSLDFKLNPVTCKASDVLLHKTGYCYAKSHLLAALLRANKIPAGLCYQRLSVDEQGPPFCLHGLNAVFLKNFGWYRIDPRGNKSGVNAQFTPPREQLAFLIRNRIEVDLPEIWSEPLAVVTSVLERYESYQEVYKHLPDIELIRSFNLETSVER